MKITGVKSNICKILQFLNCYNLTVKVNIFRISISHRIINRRTTCHIIFPLWIKTHSLKKQKHKIKTDPKRNPFFRCVCLIKKLLFFTFITQNIHRKKNHIITSIPSVERPSQSTHNEVKEASIKKSKKKKFLQKYTVSCSRFLFIEIDCCIDKRGLLFL